MIWSKTAKTPAGKRDSRDPTGRSPRRLGARPQERHWLQPARPSLCDEASEAMQEQIFSAQLFCGISEKK